MKTIRFVILSLAFLFGMVRAQVVSELPIGGLDRVMKYSLENSKGLILRIKQSNRLVVKLTVGKSFPKLTSKAELDSFYQEKLAIAARWTITNGWADRDKPFVVDAVVDRYYDEFPQLINLFLFEGEFSLLKLSDGSYKLPNLSWMKLEVPSLGIQVLIPNLNWVRMETSEAIYDSALSNSDPQIIWHSKVLVIPLDIAMSSDTTVRLISGTNFSYQVFGHDGKPQVEEPVRLILGSYPTGTSQAKKASWGDGVKSIEVRGGGVGRVLQLQQASTPQGPWLDIEDGEFTRWSSESDFIPVRTTTDINFYRVRSVKKIPTY